MIKRIFEVMANWTDSLGEVFAKFGSLKRKVTLTPHKIKHRYVIPEDLDGELAWDDEMYVNGNIFFKNRANPVKLESISDSCEWISSERYKDYMKNKLVRSLIKTTEDEGVDITTVLKIALGVIIANFGISMFLLMRLLGVL